MNQLQEIKKLEHGGIKSLIKRALELGIAVSFPSKEYPLIKLELGKDIIFLKKGEVPVESRMGSLTRNKNLTKLVLREVGIKTSKGVVATSLNEALLLAKEKDLLRPLLVKPLDDSLARGVTWNIRTNEDLRKAVHNLQKNKSFQKSKKFLVEEMFIGDEFRVLVFEKKIISCVKKVPATIIGDGKLSIKNLIKQFDKTRRRGFEIKMDKVAKETLEKNNLTLNSILEKGSILKLRDNLNMSDGGRSIDLTKEMNEKFKKICERATGILGLTYGGIDFMTKDITDGNSDYVIIEVNPNPYYNMHEKPLVEGKGIDVSYKILESIFPKLNR